MVSPFVALDIYDLVEVYAAPTLLIHPPTDMAGTSVDLGMSFGLTVPLSSYFDKL